MFQGYALFLGSWEGGGCWCHGRLHEPKGKKETHSLGSATAPAGLGAGLSREAGYFPGQAGSRAHFLLRCHQSPPAALGLHAPFLLSSPDCLCSGSVGSHGRFRHRLTPLQRTFSGLASLHSSVYAELKTPPFPSLPTEIYRPCF